MNNIKLPNGENVADVMQKLKDGEESAIKISGLLQQKTKEVKADTVYNVRRLSRLILDKYDAIDQSKEAARKKQLSSTLFQWVFLLLICCLLYMVFKS